MKKSNLIWGILFVLVGILLVLDRLNILEFNIFFSGWWTLFIIIPSLIGLINEKDKIGNLIGLVIGICLLLVMQDVIEFDLLLKLFFPIIFIIIGVSLIFKDSLNKNVQKRVKFIKNKNNKMNEYNAVFSSENLNFKDSLHISVTKFDLKINKDTRIFIKAYDELAEYCIQNLSRGDFIFVSGRINDLNEVEIEFCQKL